MINSIDDERVTFYLKHQDLIETWAAIRKDVILEAHRFYLSLVADLDELAPELGDDVEVWVREGPWNNVGLYGRPWFGESGPLIASSFEWSSTATFTGGQRAVGLRVHRKDSTDIHDYVAHEIRDIRSRTGFDRSNQSWPAFRDAPKPEGEFWTDLSDYRTALVEGVAEAWRLFADRADRAFQAWNAR